MTKAASPPPKLAFFDGDDVPLSGGYLYTYVAGTATPAKVFMNSALTLPHPNPVRLDVRGEAAVWIGDDDYDFEVTDANGNTVDSFTSVASLADEFATDPLIFYDDDGKLLSGGLLYTYAAGTTTPLATYTDSSGAVVNANPIELTSQGEASIYLTPDTEHKFVLKDALDGLIYTVDGISASIGISYFSWTDNFDRANAYILGTDWSYVPSTYISIRSNGATYLGGTTNGVASCVSEANVATFSANQEAEITIRSTAAWLIPICGPAVRVDPTFTHHGYYVECSDGVAYSVRKYGNDHGSYAVLVTTATMPMVGDKVTLRVSGTTLTLLVNDVSIWTGTDSDIATGQPGMRFRKPYTDDFYMIVDDFAAREVA